MKSILAALATIVVASAFTSFHPVSYTVDLRQSSVRWTGYSEFSFGEHSGTIKLITGDLQFEKEQLTGGHFVLDMNSIQDEDLVAGHGLENHLKSDDFFSVEKFPTAAFEIRKVIPIKNPQSNQPNFEVNGILTLKGVSNPLTFPALITTTREGAIKTHAKFKFDRTQWNVRYNSGKFFSDIGDGAISDAIAIELDILATH
ncbi:YceI family protein [Ohtaekwangia sp.]|uniref:YceI family protein n=1 Tax=Ohtaekwangia sp. TaxID=2066019 RepID=UPI002FDCBB02